MLLFAFKTLDMVNFINEFWKSLDIVRGSIEMSEIREPIIFLFFLKHANDEQLSNKSKISVPSKSQWSFLYKNVNNINFHNLLNEAFNLLEAENVFLSKIFDSVDFNDNKFRPDNDFNIISHFFRVISNFSLTKKDIQFSGFIGQLLEKFSEYEGKKITSHTTPESVTQLAVKLLNPKGGVVLDSTCGSGNFFNKIEDNFKKHKFHFYGQELNNKVLGMAKLRFAFSNRNVYKFSKAKDTLKENQFTDLKSDYVIMHPPLNLKGWINDKYVQTDSRFAENLPPENNANYAWLLHAVYHLKKKGRGIILLPLNSLYSNNKNESDIRKRLIESNLIEAIITLPSGIFNYTGIKTCFWILNKSKSTNKIFFFDTEKYATKNTRGINFTNSNIEKIKKIFNNLDEIKEISKLIELQEIRSNNYYLTPFRYFDYIDKSELNNPIALKELLDRFNGSKIIGSANIKAVSIRDLSKNADNYKTNFSDIEEIEVNANYYRFQNQKLLLLATMGGKLRPTVIDIINEEIAIQKSICAYIVNEDKVNIEFLVQELNKDYVVKQFDSLIRGSGILHVKKTDIESLIIDVPKSLKQQLEILKRERKIRFENLVLKSGFQKQLDEYRREQEADLSSKRHMLNQDVSSLNSIVEYLKGEYKIHKEGIRLETILDKRDGTTMHDILNSLTETVKVISNQVYLLSNETDPIKTEVFDLKSFLKKLAKREADMFFDIAEFYDEDFNSKIKVDKNQFRNVFKSVLDNAKRHGFINKSIKYVFKITLRDNGEFIDLIMENNGKPLPNGVTKQSYATKSLKAGNKGNTGLGGYHVDKFAKSHNIEWDLINRPKEEFTVGIFLKLNKNENV